MRIIKDDLNIDFLARRKIAAALSTLVMLAGLVGWFVLGGLNYGIDFRGGTLVQIRFSETHEIGEIRDTLARSGIGTFALQAFGDQAENEFLVSVGRADAQSIDEGEGVAQRIAEALKKDFPSLEVRRVESVGPKVGEELKLAASKAILFSLVAILIYIWLRFHWRYSVGAIVALIHDVLIVLAAFAWTQKEITLPVVAAILTVAGYSINDTIVIFDRIRENFRRFQKKKPLDVLNSSINQTLSRTLLTSGTTLFVLLSIFLFGGKIINDFAFALLIGVLAGTYSSIFIASPVVYYLLGKFPTRAR